MLKIEKIYRKKKLLLKKIFILENRFNYGAQKLYVRRNTCYFISKPLIATQLAQLHFIHNNKFFILFKGFNFISKIFVIFLLQSRTCFIIASISSDKQGTKISFFYLYIHPPDSQESNRGANEI